LSIILISIGFACTFLLGLGLLNLGPLSGILAKSSLVARRIYWDTAIRITIDRPIFGVGLDGYGDWFRRGRSAESVNANSNFLSDAAHSVPLDIASGGGLPLLLIYLSMILVTIFSIVRVVRTQTQIDLNFIALCSGWVAYQAQSLISINQLGLGVIGWIMTGLIIGYELNTRPDTNEGNPKAAPRGKASVQKISALAVITTFIATGAGIAAALPPYLAANKFYVALQSGDAEIIQPAAYLKPYERARFAYVAQLLQENKLESRAIAVLRDATEIYPDSMELWRRWSTIPSASPSDVERAKAKMKRLDPFNPDLK
jgi:hypothetical protein